MPLSCHSLAGAVFALYSSYACSWIDVIVTGAVANLDRSSMTVWKMFSTDWSQS